MQTKNRKWSADTRAMLALAVAAAAFIGGIVVATPGRAAGLGCHVGLMVGATSTTSQTSAAINGTTLLDVDSIGSSGSALGLGAGCDFVVDKILLGAFADYAWHNSTFKAQALGASINMDLDRQWTVGARTGVVLDNSLIYVLAGWTKMSTTGFAGSIGADFGDFSGVVLGGGIETALGKHAKIGIEYRHARFDDATATVSIPGGLPPGFVATASMRPTQDAVFARLTYSLDFFGSTFGGSK